MCFKIGYGYRVYDTIVIENLEREKIKIESILR